MIFIRYIGVFFILLNTYKCICLRYIEDSFYSCVETEQEIDFDYNCKNMAFLDKINCEVILNSLKIFMAQEDKFNTMELPNGVLGFYSHKNHLFKATCVKLIGIWVPKMVDSCTEDLPVFVMKNEKKEIQFLIVMPRYIQISVIPVFEYLKYCTGFFF